MPLSGPQWVAKFPTSKSINDLVEPFRSNVRRFIAALQAAHATVSIADTLRPSERVHLMHFSFAVAREGLDPATVPVKPGVDIQWVHTDALGKPDLVASKAAAEQMVRNYEIVFKPALSSRHTEGNAIDMTITWHGALSIIDGTGTQVTITSSPFTGAGNADLHKLGLTYGVNKLLSDAPHWSSDGH
jgi:plastocyanin